MSFMAALEITVLLDDEPIKIKLVLMSLDTHFGKKMTFKDLGETVKGVVDIFEKVGVAEKKYDADDGSARHLFIICNKNMERPALEIAADVYRELKIKHKEVPKSLLEKELAEILKEYKRAT